MDTTPIPFSQHGQRPGQVRLSEVVGALSYALDITEGQPEGHAVRTCLIGMRLAQELGLDERERSALFYALLLKDLGCSSNAAKIAYLFGAADQRVKFGFKFTDWQSVMKSLPYIISSVAPDGPLPERFKRFLHIAFRGTKGAKELIAIRCERGEAIARALGMPDETATAIRNLDEHWNGKGHPDGVRGHDIPRLARILNIAQVADVFATRYGLAAALSIVRARKGRWFDPELCRAFESIADDTGFWMGVLTGDPRAQLSRWEPEGMIRTADDAVLDTLCAGFGMVIDAKSPWTACHSQGVADVARGIGAQLGMDARAQTRLHRAGMLHDIGKLGVPSAILDKPDKLTDHEFAVLKKHPADTHRILSRSEAFADVVELAARHHEKLDGSGYHRGLPGDALTQGERVLCVADIYEALAAKRPYRKDLTDGEVFDILGSMAAKGAVCPASVDACRAFVHETGFECYQVAA